MIKRSYFMSIKKTKQDGTGSYSHAHTIGTFSSWLPKSNLVYKEIKRKLCADVSHIDGDDSTVEVVSFNRV